MKLCVLRLMCLFFPFQAGDVQFDAEKAAELILELGVPVATVARQLGMSKPTLYKRMKESGTEMFLNIELTKN